MLCAYAEWFDSITTRRRKVLEDLNRLVPGQENYKFEMGHKIFLGLLTDQEIIEKYQDRLDENEYEVIKVKSENSFLVKTKSGTRETITFLK